MGCLCIGIFIYSVISLVSFLLSPGKLLFEPNSPYKFGVVCLITLASLSYYVWWVSKERYNELSDKLSNEYKEKENELGKFKAELSKEHELKYRLLSDKLSDEYKRKESELAKFKTDLSNEYKLKYRQLNDAESNIKGLLRSTTPFKRSATLVADVESLYFDDCSRFLKYKKHPAASAAMEVQRVKREAANYIKLYREMVYKYEYILSAFPELMEYVEDEDTLIEVGESLSLDEIEDKRDRAKDYLSKEEWSSLSETERNQLALDRYIKRQKTPWQIGRDFEMCCSYLLERKGYKVTQHGILNGVHDLGRDLIAIKQNTAYSSERLIIQCKCWNSKREIRENVVFQLYGTYIAYELEHLHKKTSLFDDKVLCVLMIPTFSKLSAVAKEFCKRLNIVIWAVNYDSFPRIKCNINNGIKIYHLPFDQQYDRTQIKNQGECMVSTVYEAEALGFRRALRHYF